MIPARGPNEAPDQYLKRLQDYDRLMREAEKEIKRQERRIRSEVERVLIDRAVKDALPARPRGRPREDPRGSRWYRLPGPGAGVLLIFYPLYLLLSLIWQNVTKTDNRYDQGLTISRGDKMR